MDIYMEISKYDLELFREPRIELKPTFDLYVWYRFNSILC